MLESKNICKTKICINITYKDNYVVKCINGRSFSDQKKMEW